jgi:hypothetical protein
MKAMVFEHHAVERYIERYAPGTPLPKATRDLQALAAGACRLREKRSDGKDQWKAEDGTIFVVSYERGLRRCVTVLPVGADDRFIDEQRVSVPGDVVDPGTQAMRLAVSYLLERASVDPIARDVRDRIQAIAPWALSPAAVDPSNDTIAADGTGGRDA